MLIYVPFVIPETPKENFQISCALFDRGSDRNCIWYQRIPILSSDPQRCPDPDQDPQKGFRSWIFRSFCPILQYIEYRTLSECRRLTVAMHLP